MNINATMCLGRRRCSRCDKKVHVLALSLSLSLSLSSTLVMRSDLSRLLLLLFSYKSLKQGTEPFSSDDNDRRKTDDKGKKSAVIVR